METTSESTPVASTSAQSSTPSTPQTSPTNSPSSPVNSASTGATNSPPSENSQAAKPSPLDSIKGQLEGLDEGAATELIQRMLERFPVKIKRKGQEVAITDFARLKTAASLEHNWGQVGNEMAAKAKQLEAERAKVQAVLNGDPEALRELLDKPEALERAKQLMYERMVREQQLEGLDPEVRKVVERNRELETKFQQIERERQEQEVQAIEAQKAAATQASNQKIQAKLMQLIQGVDMPVEIFRGVAEDLVRDLEDNLRLEEPDPPEVVAERFREKLHARDNWRFEKSVLAEGATAKQKLASVSPKVSEALAWAWVEEHPEFEQKVAKRMLDRMQKSAPIPTQATEKPKEPVFDEEHWRRVRNGIILG